MHPRLRPWYQQFVKKWYLWLPLLLFYWFLSGIIEDWFFEYARKYIASHSDSLVLILGFILKYYWISWLLIPVLIMVLIVWTYIEAGHIQDKTETDESAKEKTKILVQIPAIKIWQFVGSTNYGIFMAAEIYNPNQRPITIRSKLIIGKEEKPVGHENIIGKPEMELFLEPGRNLRRLLTAYYPFNPSELEACLKSYEVDGTEVFEKTLKLPVYIEDKTKIEESDLLKIINDLKSYWELYFKLVKEVIEEIKKYKMPLPTDWTTEKNQKLKEYLTEIDNMCLSLKINRQRLYFLKQKWGESDATFKHVKYKYYFVDINSVDDILKHYELAKTYGMLDKIQKNLEESYHKFLDELATLETTISIKRRLK